MTAILGGHRGDRGKSAAGEYALPGEVRTCGHAVSQAERDTVSIGRLITYSRGEATGE
jgi:hypothetical protein